jgi:uncharacterized OB-fold protein
MTDMRTPERPQPLHDTVSSGYWEACARGELLVQRCTSCGQLQHYPRVMCTQCAGEPEWQQVSGRGTVHTFTIIRQNYAKPFRELLPYAVAMIELDEGPMLMSNVTDCDVDDMRIGMAVEVWFDSDGAEGAIPYWRPAKPDR